MAVRARLAAPAIRRHQGAAARAGGTQGLSLPNRPSKRFNPARQLPLLNGNPAHLSHMHPRRKHGGASSGPWSTTRILLAHALAVLRPLFRLPPPALDDILHSPACVLPRSLDHFCNPAALSRCHSCCCRNIPRQLHTLSESHITAVQSLCLLPRHHCRRDP